jgi:hypothetical protein
MGIGSLLSARRVRREEHQRTLLLVRNQTRNTILADSAEIANTSATRRKGLLGRRSLEPGQGLWIVPCESVHTFAMRFPIDVIYLDRKSRVQKTRTSMPAGRLSLCLFAHSVLELPSGTIEGTGTRPGDQLQLVHISSDSQSGSCNLQQSTHNVKVEV